MAGWLGVAVARSIHAIRSRCFVIIKIMSDSSI